MSQLTTLKKYGKVYLGGHSSKNVDKIAISLISGYLERKNFVPGFADVLCVTSFKRLPTIRKFKNLPFSLHVCMPGKLPEVKPDLLWVDDNHLLSSVIRKLELRYSLIPHIFSGSKSDGKLRLIADTREQCPIWKGIDCKKMKLDVGDYTTEILHNRFHVERKSLQDLYGSIVQSHVRFRKELIRAAVNDIKLAIFVEGSKKNFITLNFPGGSQRNMKGATLEKIINTVERKYETEVVWCKSRSDMKKQIYSRLKKEESKFKII